MSIDRTLGALQCWAQHRWVLTVDRAEGRGLPLKGHAVLIIDDRNGDHRLASDRYRAVFAAKAREWYTVSSVPLSPDRLRIEL